LDVIESRISGILPHLDPKSNHMHMARIGAITIAWAKLERAMDLCNRLILHKLGGKAIQADMPVSLKAKIDFFKKAHGRLSALASVKRRGATIAAEIKRLKERRHDCIHGYAASVESDGTRIMRRTVYDGDQIDSQNTPYSPDQMLGLFEDISRITSILVRHCDRLIDALEKAQDRDG
jgi:hypothetical protein